MPALTGFVSHSACGRHDTGWNHPDHQGRLPALMRAVYRDMLTLHGHLLEIEGRLAAESELALFHRPAYLAQLLEWATEAARQGQPIEAWPGTMLSGASWEAARAAAGSVLTAIDEVQSGRIRNAFCAVRPPGSSALAGAPGGFALLNSVAIAARYLQERLELAPVLILEWGAERSILSTLFAGDSAVRVLSLRDPADTASVLETESRPSLPVGGGEAESTSGHSEPEQGSLPPHFVILSLGLPPPEDSLLRTRTALTIYEATVAVRSWAERVCGGRIVSVLEGGYDPEYLGLATVQHLRGLTGLPAATAND